MQENLKKTDHEKVVIKVKLEVLNPSGTKLNTDVRGAFRTLLNI